MKNFEKINPASSVSMYLSPVISYLEFVSSKINLKSFNYEKFLY